MVNMKIPCPICKGRGKIPSLDFLGPMYYYNPYYQESWPYKICPICHGTGIQDYL